MPNVLPHWLDFSDDGFAAMVESWGGQPGYRARQLLDWLHVKRMEDCREMTNIPPGIRATMVFDGRLRVFEERQRRDSPDGLTSKWLLGFPEIRNQPLDPALVECVLIIEKQLSRRTVCVSSMAGCPLGCVFCATGQQGFVRNLAAGEILEQVYRVDAHAQTLGDGMGVSHVVFMGMGEPLLNFDPVLAAADRLANPRTGMGLSGRHITISTAGVPEGIRRLAGMGRNYRLAVSLHAPTQALREMLMPAARRWPLGELFPALEEFALTASRDLTFEYCLIDGTNAGEKEAKQLVKLLSGLRAKVNLIPLNPVPGFAGRPPSKARVAAFQAILEAGGVPATVRMEKGADIGAACGQLRAETKTD